MADDKRINMDEYKTDEAAQNLLNIMDGKNQKKAKKMADRFKNKISSDAAQIDKAKEKNNSIMIDAKSNKKQVTKKNKAPLQNKKEKTEKKQETVPSEEKKEKGELLDKQEEHKEKEIEKEENSKESSEEQHKETDNNSEFEEDVRKKLSECVASVNELVEDEDLSLPAVNAEETKKENEKRLEEYNKKQLEETVDALEKSRDTLIEAVKNKKAYDKWDKETSDETHTAPAEKAPPKNSEEKKEKTYVLSSSPERLTRRREKEETFEEVNQNPVKKEEGFVIVLAESGECFDINSDYYTIGKSEECSLVLPYTYISRRHALITRVDGSYYIEDLGSTNGTFVSGIKLTTGKKTRIIPGEKIKFANINVIIRTA